MSIEHKENLPYRPEQITAFPLRELPIIKPGINLPEVLYSTTKKNKLTINENDILVVAQKIVSKAENRFLDLSKIHISAEAVRLSNITGRPASFVQAVINESQEIIQVEPGTINSPGMILVKHKLGHVCTSAGIDKSNTGSQNTNIVTLLPVNPDESAQRISQYFETKIGKKIGVIIVDSMGDAHRLGAIGKAIGVSNVPARIYKLGLQDLDGKPTKSDIAYADAVAGYAMIIMGQTNEKIASILISGLEYQIDPLSKISDVLI